jgi:hypothetical protein
LDDDALPPAEPPKPSRPAWLIPVGAIAVLMLAALVLGAGAFTVRRQAMQQRDEHVAVMRLDEAERARAEMTRAEMGRAREPLDRRPFDGAVTPKGGMNVQALAQEYGADEVSAAEKYTGRRIRFVGVMHRLEKLGDGGSVMSVEYLVDGQMSRGVVRAYFPAAESEKLATFERGSPAHFDGTCAGWDRTAVPAIIAIRDCHVVPAPPK